ncbi:hypothetical protein DKX38_016032 [Salix brachista]|uniref:SPX domain-containing protein n=1 Tax=Salix brachista TaxID=2182728 RepID=A0A5N5L6X4_9ROSI|nr:hypothetical protein DKX38_016032 [Salix brachista]
MDYDFLKTLLKEIREIRGFRLRTNPPATTPDGLTRNLTLYRAFSGLTRRDTTYTPVSPSSPDLELQPILVNSVNLAGSQSYQTTFLMPSIQGGEYELVFFRRLDDEFNRVEKFYRSKVDEVLKEAAMLNEQMDALIAFRIKVENPSGWSDRVADMTRLASDVAASTTALAAASPSGARSRRGALHLLDVIEEGQSLHERSDKSNHDEVEKKSDNTGQKEEEEENPKIMATPRSTIKNFLEVPHQTELRFTRENLRKVEEQLKGAFVEFYQKLRLLKSYSFLNTLAFSKIMKKYDKACKSSLRTSDFSSLIITTRDASKVYMKMVDNSYLGSSDEQRDEFIQQLQKAKMEEQQKSQLEVYRLERRLYMMDNLLEGYRKELNESHETILKDTGEKGATGWRRLERGLCFFSGCTVALIIALALIVKARKLMNKPGRVTYMHTMFPLYRGPASSGHKARAREQEKTRNRLARGPKAYKRAKGLKRKP